MNKEKIAVSGVRGFIGSNLIKVLDTKKISSQEINRDSTSFWDQKSIEELSNCHTIIHLAGLAHSKTSTEADYYRSNVDATVDLAEKAISAKIKRFIFVSSIGVNGNKTEYEQFSSKSISNPHNPYAKSKYNAELALKEIADKNNLELVIIRPTLVYGYKAPGNFALLVKLIRKMPLLPFGVINNKRNFISVDNLVDLLITCSFHPNAPGKVFLAAEPQAISTKELTSQIARGLNKKIYQLPIPNCLLALAGIVSGKKQAIEQLTSNLEVDTSELQKTLNWTPTYSMEEVMKKLGK